MALPTPVLIEDSDLTSWEWIGFGGFGEIYKAKHPLWDYEVAIKLLHNDGGDRTSCLLREVRMMLRGSSKHVMQVLGVFIGRSPKSGPSEQLGLVMKYMEKGSLESLQKHLDGVQQLPLVFRLAHQVALGINFLHSLPTPLLHHDLKPSNVLLDSDLNVKLTDFGLSKASQTQAQVSKKDLEDEGGTTNYMPPEAFGLNYKPSRAFDIYSYGILLWSIATGKQPYAHAPPSVVVVLIPKGHRPSLDELSKQAELSGLMELMEKCWETSPTQRPSSSDCTKITEKLYQTHEHGINEAVHEVLKKLRNTRDPPELSLPGCRMSFVPEHFTQRLAHQVALGINFLHSLPTPLLHHDLKPNNVLLDSDINVKLTDFGLSKPSQTWAQFSKKDKGDGGGTIIFMPPEAFGLNYKPSRTYDIYSFGILLWSIATGEQPYAPYCIELEAHA
ncbi:receptor-interacting serine/threonine-protein kinase 3-like [Limanda limanda]|uniref:receptor-interacting serine/threonine-protein kinase 3-like n=1 Tax=Limanda limanda TaxID=27771 RepID=UPI0029C89291|nr:receptor-interacting serine/threonine-protein kinase 3-like [Limanda limanda]